MDVVPTTAVGGISCSYYGSVVWGVAGTTVATPVGTGELLYSGQVGVKVTTTIYNY